MDAPELHLTEPWFYGKLPRGREEGSEIVKEHNVQGCFLVRNSDTLPHEYALCLM